MTATMDPTSTAEVPALEAVRALAPEISARAPEIEAAGRLPADLLDSLKRAGCFRLLVPASHGGDGAPLADALRVFERLAQADGSVGWTVMIGSSAWCDLAGLPRPTFDAVYADGPDVVVAGAINPSGTAVAVDDGYRVRGRWGFVSGCEHADWLYGNCIEIVDGDPAMRIAVFRPDEVEIEDTWDVVGLRGTGSHHVTADDVVVPPDRSFPTLGDDACVDVPIVRVPPPALYSLEIASVAIGIAQGALDDVVELAGAKVPLLAGSALADDRIFQHRLAAVDAQLRAARSLLHEDTAAAWSAAAAGRPLDDDLRARVRATAAWAASTAAATVDAAYTAAGGTSVYRTSPLQRRLRDVHALTQHFLVRPNTFATAGALLLGRDADVPIF